MASSRRNAYQCSRQFYLPDIVSQPERLLGAAEAVTNRILELAEKFNQSENQTS